MTQKEILALARTLVAELDENKSHAARCHYAANLAATARCTDDTPGVREMRQAALIALPSVLEALQRTQPSPDRW